MTSDRGPGSAPRRVAFRALEYRADQTVERVRLEFVGSEEEGWEVSRNGAPHLELGPGYRLLRCGSCGVCSTDLDRHFLPFPLPQVTGHELIAFDDAGGRVVVEINASHLARGVAGGLADPCPCCANGLETHCPERLVLGIHDLPGGFGAYVLAPARAIVPVPAAVPDDAAVLVEPFAAALHAVRRSPPRDGDVVAVLGPRKLGSLVLAALAAERRRLGRRFEIVALARRAELRRLGLAMGADRADAVPEDGADADSGAPDLVFDTTASPEGLERALGLARREVHLKSTHGRPACGLSHPTELVVDEISLAPVPGEAAARDAWPGPAALGRGDGRPWIAWSSRAAVPDWIAAGSRVTDLRDAADALSKLEEQALPSELPRPDVVVVDSAAEVDRVLRPRPDVETALVRPRGEIWLAGGAGGGPIERAVVDRGVRLSTSRCGRFGEALALLAADRGLCERLGRLVTHRFPARRLADALSTARSPAAIKAVVEHASPAS